MVGFEKGSRKSLRNAVAVMGSVLQMPLRDREGEGCGEPKPEDLPDVRYFWDYGS